MTMTDSTSLDTEDLTWMILWTQIVPAMSIIITCGMLLRPILQKILPKTSRRSGVTTARRYNIIDGTDQSYTRREWTQDSDLAKPSAAYALREREALPDR